MRGERSEPDSQGREERPVLSLEDKIEVCQVERIPGRGHSKVQRHERAECLRKHQAFHYGYRMWYILESLLERYESHDQKAQTLFRRQWRNTDGSKTVRDLLAFAF